MNHWIKVVGVVAVVGCATSAVAAGQAQDRGRGGAIEARQNAEQRVQEAAKTAEAHKQEEPRVGAAREIGAGAAERGSDRAPQTAGEARGDSGAAPQAGQSKREAAMERQGAQLEEVHARRMAQLQRLRDLAVENDRKDMIARVDGLIARELERQSRVQNRGRPSDAPAPAGQARLEQAGR